MGQTPRHLDQDTLDTVNKAWYWRGWWSGFVIGVSIASVIALVLF